MGANREVARRSCRHKDLSRRHARTECAGDAREGETFGRGTEKARLDYCRLPAVDVGFGEACGIAATGSVADFARAEGPRERAERAARGVVAALTRPAVPSRS